MIFECSWRRAGAKGKVTAEKVKVASSFKLQDHFKISFYNFNQFDTAKQGKRSELGKRNADRKSTLTEKKGNVDEILSDMGNSPIINDFVE